MRNWFRWVAMILPHIAAFVLSQKSTEHRDKDDDLSLAYEGGFIATIVGSIVLAFVAFLLGHDEHRLRNSIGAAFLNALLAGAAVSAGEIWQKRGPTRLDSKSYEFLRSL